jgi:methylated-DNA-protein-cysteine methyltransferase-like protein
MIFLPRTEQHAFNEQIWNLAREVPEGKVATYGQLAQMLSPPTGFSAEDYKAFSPRWAGDAMAACPGDVPWHRIINSQGKISLKRDAQRQQRLLEDEGLEFINDKIDLKRHQWGNADQAETPKQETLF